MLRFIEVGEGVSEDPVAENTEIVEDHYNSFFENKLEEQSIDNQETQTDNPNVMEAGPAPSTPTIVTTSGRVSRPPVRLIEEMGEADLTAAKRNYSYYFAMSELKEEREYGCVGAGIGSGINNMHELKVLSFDEAMATEDHHEWDKSVK